MVPVNPNATNLDGRPCFARVQDIQPPVDAVLLMTSPEATEIIVKDCAEAGINRSGCIGQRAAAPSARRQSRFATSEGCNSFPGSAR